MTAAASSAWTLMPDSTFQDFRNEREKQKSRYYVVSEDTTCSKHTNTMARMSFLERWKDLPAVKGKHRTSREG